MRPTSFVSRIQKRSDSSSLSRGAKRVRLRSSAVICSGSSLRLRRASRLYPWACAAPRAPLQPELIPHGVAEPRAESGMQVCVAPPYSYHVSQPTASRRWSRSIGSPAAMVHATTQRCGVTFPSVEINRPDRAVNLAIYFALFIIAPGFRVCPVSSSASCPTRHSAARRSDPTFGHLQSPAQCAANPARSASGTPANNSGEHSSVHWLEFQRYIAVHSCAALSPRLMRFPPLSMAALHQHYLPCTSRDRLHFAKCS